MKSYRAKSCSAALIAAGLVLGPQAFGQTAPDTVEAHIAAAKAAAGPHGYILKNLCMTPAEGPTTAPAAEAAPERSTWHVEPVKVFDNLYFVGEKEYSAWAVKTSEGIILLDTIWDYSVEDEVVGGLKKLGLDPAQAQICAREPRPHDHIGGAKYLQDKFGTRIILSEIDWDLVETSTRVPTKPKRDMIATDGQKLTLGDTTITIYLTPGHTLGTMSTLIPVKDNGKQHLVAEWGGTGFNFEHSRPRFETYAASAQRFGDIVAKSGADVLSPITPTSTDSTDKMAGAGRPQARRRKPLRDRKHRRSAATSRSPRNAPGRLCCGRSEGGAESA